MKWTHSSDKRRLIALCCVLACAASASAQGQTDARVRYEALYELETRVSTSASATAVDFRDVIDKYWSLVRRYPSNGYADNALWQAGNLSMEAFRRFSEDRDKYRSIQLFQWLKDQYPHSRYAGDAATQAEQLAAAPAPAPATIRAIHREALPEVVRVTIEMDREVPFYQETLANPARLFFDLKSTTTVPALIDKTFRYEGDAVREVRLGRHPNGTTRVVVDLENVTRHSVFTLYEPYRIVIDSEPVAGIKGSRGAKGAESTKPVATIAARALPEPDLTASDALPAVSTPSPPPGPAVPPASHAPAAPPAPRMPAANSNGKFSVARQLGLGVSRIVIDAGHGGHDPGAAAFGISEADLVLDVALRLEKLLLKQAGVDVVLTRRTDEYIALEERTGIVNREEADLFLSIHANASANRNARGVETYFLNFALNPQAEAVAARENAASGKTMNSLPGIIKAITLNSKLNESRDFAGLIQRELVRGLRPSHRSLKDLGVKQAPFMVLIGASMPSVLAEISFVTNRQEARLLKTPAYRQQIAESLLAGILRYQQALKKAPTVALASQP
jgi:N-acetylmuramoyl-L-alanine amidase